MSKSTSIESPQLFRTERRFLLRDFLEISFKSAITLFLVEPKQDDDISQSDNTGKVQDFKVSRAVFPECLDNITQDKSLIAIHTFRKKSINTQSSNIKQLLSKYNSKYEPISPPLHFEMDPSPESLSSSGAAMSPTYSESEDVADSCDDSYGSPKETHMAPTNTISEFVAQIALTFTPLSISAPYWSHTLKDETNKSSEYVPSGALFGRRASESYYQHMPTTHPLPSISSPKTPSLVIDKPIMEVIPPGTTRHSPKFTDSSHSVPLRRFSFATDGIATSVHLRHGFLDSSETARSNLRSIKECDEERNPSVSAICSSRTKKSESLEHSSGIVFSDDAEEHKIPDALQCTTSTTSTDLGDQAFSTTISNMESQDASTHEVTSVSVCSELAIEEDEEHVFDPFTPAVALSSSPFSQRDERGNCISTTTTSDSDFKRVPTPPCSIDQSHPLERERGGSVSFSENSSSTFSPVHYDGAGKDTNPPPMAPEYNYIQQDIWLFIGNSASPALKTFSKYIAAQNVHEQRSMTYTGAIKHLSGRFNRVPLSSMFIDDISWLLQRKKEAGQQRPEFKAQQEKELQKLKEGEEEESQQKKQERKGDDISNNEEEKEEPEQASHRLKDSISEEEPTKSPIHQSRISHILRDGKVVHGEGTLPWSQMDSVALSNFLSTPSSVEDRRVCMLSHLSAAHSCLKECIPSISSLLSLLSVPLSSVGLSTKRKEGECGCEEVLLSPVHERLISCYLCPIVRSMCLVKQMLQHHHYQGYSCNLFVSENAKKSARIGVQGGGDAEIMKEYMIPPRSLREMSSPSSSSPNSIRSPPVRSPSKVVFSQHPRQGKGGKAKNFSHRANIDGVMAKFRTEAAVPSRGFGFISDFPQTSEILLFMNNFQLMEGLLGLREQREWMEKSVSRWRHRILQRSLVWHSRMSDKHKRLGHSIAESSLPQYQGQEQLSKEEEEEEEEEQDRILSLSQKAEDTENDSGIKYSCDLAPVKKNPSLSEGHVLPLEREEGPTSQTQRRSPVVTTSPFLATLQRDLDKQIYSAQNKAIGKKIRTIGPVDNSGLNPFRSDHQTRLRMREIERDIYMEKERAKQREEWEKQWKAKRVQRKDGSSKKLGPHMVGVKFSPPSKKGTVSFHERQVGSIGVKTQEIGAVSDTTRSTRKGT
ncbi:hypothetical protein ADUPG1_008908, partial [Aduncisulcus paluster]